MDNDLEQRIRERAYELWEREGRSGDPEDHWSRAERELTGSAASNAAGPSEAGTTEEERTEDKIIDTLGDFA